MTTQAIDLSIQTHLTPRLLKEWQALWDSSPQANYINSPAWLLANIKTFDFDEFKIVTGYEDGQLKAVAPLCKTRIYGISVYTLTPRDYVCGTPYLIDNSINADAQKRFWKAITDVGLIVYYNVPSKMALANDNISYIPATLNYLFPIEKNLDGEPIIANRQDFLNHVKNKYDQYTVKCFYGDKKALREVFRIDQISRKHERGYDTFQDKDIRTFYLALSQYFPQNLMIHLLQYASQTIAYSIGFLVGSTFTGNQIGYDKQYRKIGPGKVLIIRLIEDLTGRGIKVLDLGTGDSHVKRLLTNQVQPLYTVIIGNPLLRLYLKTVISIRTSMFEKINQHEKLYKLYKSIQKVTTL